MRRSLAIQEKLRSPNDPNLAGVLTYLGSALVDEGQLEEARSHLERALALHEGHAEDAAERGSTRFALARAIWKTDRDRSLTLAKQASDDYAERGNAYTGTLGEIDEGLKKRRK